MSISLTFNPASIADYGMFIKVKSLPRYRFSGGFAQVPDEYADQLGIKRAAIAPQTYKPLPCLFDYQRDISAIAVRKQKFAVFADCGLGKTLILLEFAKHVHGERRGRTLIVSPLMVVEQTLAEARRFYGDSLPIVRVRAHELAEWLRTGDGVAITNYDAITPDLPASELSGIILDESSMLKSHYGAWGTRLIELGRGVPYKLCLTGTPAPNDRIEYANHAVFLDAFPTVNSFLARFFVNRGQTQDRWELKPWALAPFYSALSDWCIFLSNPAVYGWKDGCGTVPPIHTHIHHVSLTSQQRDAAQQVTGDLFTTELGGIGQRAKIARIGKGFHNGEAIETGKMKAIVDLVRSWPDESTIVWCKYNGEQDAVHAALEGSGNISGDTGEDERLRIIDGFKSGTIKVLVSKPKILGFGLNLQVCTRQVFSTLQDSYEEFYQAVKRSNRYGSTRPLNVHIPVTELEWPMVQNVLRKADRVQADTESQERIFREHSAA